MSKSKQLSLTEVQEGADKLELEDQLVLFARLDEVIKTKQATLSDQMKKIEEIKAKMNGN